MILNYVYVEKVSPPKTGKLIIAILSFAVSSIFTLLLQYLLVNFCLCFHQNDIFEWLCLLG